jgi:hypothetical protein
MSRLTPTSPHTLYARRVAPNTAIMLPASDTMPARTIPPAPWRRTVFSWSPTGPVVAWKDGGVHRNLRVHCLNGARHPLVHVK